MFETFYSYFLYTKSWAYVLMIITLPIFVAYWNYVLFPINKTPCEAIFGDDDDEEGGH